MGRQKPRSKHVATISQKAAISEWWNCFERRENRALPNNPCVVDGPVVKGVGAGSAEKGRDADDTVKGAQCTVHATDGETQQQRHKAVDG